ncbi:MAG: hypothetical protein K8U57_29575 [Planctomycetes bacterium]|nr:hypothetical protein [Planctomycetota bacterium]
MTPEHPHHSSEAFMHNATPVQSFVSPALEMGPEELARPRYGRPQRKPMTPQPETPKPTDGETEVKP